MKSIIAICYNNIFMVQPMVLWMILPAIAFFVRSSQLKKLFLKHVSLILILFKTKLLEVQVRI